MTARMFVAVALAWCAAVSAVAAQQRDPSSHQPAPATGTARVFGRVVAADTGAPVRNAKVTLSAQELNTTWIATTDDEGRFDLQNMPAATFAIRIQKAGFVEAAPPNVQLQDTLELDRGQIEIVRGGVITGRAIDVNGEPVAEANVGAARIRYRTPGTGSLYPVQSVRTNDLGEFRIYGLQPGSYYVYAGLGTIRLQTGGAGGEPQVIYANASSAPALTFYPSVPRASDAQPVEVKGGEPVFVNLRLSQVPLATISGRIVDSSGQPAPDFLVMLTQPPPYGALNFRAEGVVVDAQGRFSVNNIQPGDYHLDVLSREFMEALGRGDANMGDARALGEYAGIDITVSGDVANLVIQTTKGFEVRGRVTVDGGAMPPSWLPRFGLRGGGQFTGRGDVAADGTFVLRGMDGHRRIHVTGLPAGAMVERVVVRGRDVTDDGFDVDGDIAGAEIMITTAPPVVAGRVVSTGGEAVQGDVIVYAANADLWSQPDARYVKTGHGSVEQGFRITGLPPGRYLAVAVEHLEEFDWANPANLERLRAVATPIALASGEARTLTLVRR
jgi:protocatechuate 3,4-dioxygenase beta subunit